MDVDKLADLWLLERATLVELSGFFQVTVPEIQLALKQNGMPFKNRGAAKYQSLCMTSLQTEAFIGMLLGDGNLTRNRNRGNALFRFNHSGKQKDYAFHKHEVLKPFSNYTLESEAGGYTKILVSTCPHPIFTWWHRKFYPARRKVVPQEVFALLSPRALAYWFMDDGGEMDFGSSVRLATNGFFHSEVEGLCRFLNMKYQFSFEVRDYGYGPVLRFSKPLRFLDLVEPYIIPSMRYKLSKFK